MSSLEYLLFGINMIFLIDYTFRQAQAVDIFEHFPRESLPAQTAVFASEERALALKLMAMIDQLLLFFYALKVCLTFSQNITHDIFEDEIQAELVEEEARMIGTSILNSS
jgi:hypothetical protein